MESYLVLYVIAGLLLMLEAFTPGLFIFICFAAATAISGAIDHFTELSFTWVLVIDLVLSVIFIIALQPILRRVIKLPVLEGTAYPGNLIGQEAMVFKIITKTEPGAVKLYDIDETWLAKSEDGSDIGIGTTVEVRNIEGNHLIVKPL